MGQDRLRDLAVVRSCFERPPVAARKRTFAVIVVGGEHRQCRGKETQPDPPKVALAHVSPSHPVDADATYIPPSRTLGTPPAPRREARGKRSFPERVSCSLET